MADTSSFEEARRQLDAALRALMEESPETVPATNFAATPGLEPPSGSEAAPAGVRAAKAPPARLRTATRLAIGSVLLGFDEIERRAPEWERRAAEELVAAQGEHAAAPPARTIARAGGADDALRQTLVGWLFTTQDELLADTDPARWFAAVSGQLFDTAVAVARTSLGMIVGTRRNPAPAAADLVRWQARGRAEEAHSRRLARIALQDIVQDVIDALAREPAVRELIQTHSTGMAEDVLGEVRERTVSGDMALENLVRRLFRRPPRPFARSVPADTAPGGEASDEPVP